MVKKKMVKKKMAKKKKTPKGNGSRLFPFAVGAICFVLVFGVRIAISIKRHVTIAMKKQEEEQKEEWIRNSNRFQRPLPSIDIDYKLADPDDARQSIHEAVMKKLEKEQAEEARRKNEEVMKEFKEAGKKHDKEMKKKRKEFEEYRKENRN